MSHAATNWAIQQRGLKPTTKIVLRSEERRVGKEC